MADRGLKWYRSSPAVQRGFCCECGSALFWKPDSDDRISVYAGTLDGQTGLGISSHIYLEEKGDYYEVEAGAVTYGKGGAKLTLS